MKWPLQRYFEFIVITQRPFRAKTNEGLTNAIMHEEVPLDALSKNTADMVDMIKLFLERDVKKRLGVKEMGGFDALKAHAVFKALDWEVVALKNWPPPFVPDVTFGLTRYSRKRRTLMLPTSSKSCYLKTTL